MAKQKTTNPNLPNAFDQLVPALVMGIDGSILECNPSAQYLLSLREPTEKLYLLPDLLRECSLPDLVAACHQLSDKDEVTTFEAYTAEQRFLRFRASRLNAIQFLLIFDQYTPLQQNVTAQLLSEIFDKTSELVLCLDRQLRIKLASNAAQTILGVPANQLNGLILTNLIHPEDCSKFLNLVRLPQSRMETRIQTKDLTWLEIELRSFNYLSDSELNAIIVFCKDITHLKNVSNQLSKTQQQYASLIELQSDYILHFNATGQVLFHNPAYKVLNAQLGNLPYFCSDIFKHYGPQFTERLINKFTNINTNELWQHEETLELTNGERLTILWSEKPLRNATGQVESYLRVGRDITKVKQSEIEQIKIAKMDALSLMAGGIAHDYNNILTIILGNLGQVHSRVRGMGVDHNIKAIEAACGKARRLSTQLSMLTKQQQPLRESTQINDIVYSISTLALANSNCLSQLSLLPNLPHVQVDPTQIEQVIQNMLVNAQQAMPQGGIINISTERVTVQPQEVPQLQPGNYVCIKIRDNGVGIPTDTISHIFDPYFSTKKTGSGLGLATSFAIILNHAGTIRVQSELNKYTEFSIFLPISETIPTTEPVTAPPPYKKQVLFMDDDLALRELALSMFPVQQFDCTTVSKGEEAIEQAKKKHFDYIFLDLTIVGGLGGEETVQQLLRINPTLCTIAMSGYETGAVMRNPTAFGFRASIAKPFIWDNIRTLIDRLDANN